MNKSLIIKMLTGISLATINALASRENGIGSKVFTGVEGVNTLYKIRKSILTEKIELKLRDKNISLNSRSFLNNVSEDVVNLSTYDSITMRVNGAEVPMVSKLADMIETDLFTVRDEVIPMVNELTATIESAVAGMVTSSISGTFNIQYTNTNNMLEILNQVGDLVDDRNISIDGINASMPEIGSITELKQLTLIGNPIVDNSINNILMSREDKYWIDLYNSVFTNLKASNGLIKTLLEDKILHVDRNVILYLIARKLNKGVDITINGNKEDFVYSIRVFKEYVSSVLADTAHMLKTLNELKVLIVHNKNNDIVVDRSLMVDGIDADVVLAAAMNGMDSQEKILAEKDSLKQKYIQANELFAEAELSKASNNYRAVIMNTLDKALVDCKEYDDSRLKISNIVYSKTLDELRNVKKIVSKILVKTKFKDTGAEYVLENMKKHAVATEGESLDYGAISEYIALEMISEYLVNTHIVID